MPCKKGFFDLAGIIPEVESNVSLIKGWISNTLPEFISQSPEQIAFIHIDTDTYTPCKTILELCGERLADQAAILFDELLCYPGWKYGALKALEEVFDPAQYTWRAFAGHWACLTVNKGINKK